MTDHIKYSLPWIEKYRPNSLDDMIDHNEKINTLKALIEKNEMTHLLFYGAPGCGKCLGKGTLILMHDGILKKVEDLIPNDLVMGDDSNPRKILSICKGNDQMYKIIPENGKSWTCNGPHILCLKKSKKNYVKWNDDKQCYSVIWSENHTEKITNFFLENKITKQNINNCNENDDAYKQSITFLNHQIKNNINYNDLNDIIEISVVDYLNKDSNWKEDYKLYKTSINFPNKNIDIDPYIMGYILSSYLLNGTNIQLQNKKIAKYFREHNLEPKKLSGTMNCSLINNLKSKNWIIDVSDILSNQKLNQYEQIPNDYKFNSRNNRLSLLAGIIDYNGYYESDCYYIVERNEQFVNDITNVARSLGFCAQQSIITKQSEYQIDTYYECIISGFGLDELPILIDYKKSLTKDKNPNDLLTNFIVESINNDEYYGFELDGNGRFILEDYTVTHNTSMILACAREMYGDQYKKYILELNASDDRGIETVRKKIPDFVRTASNKIRLVILDEADAMTNDAQSALRRVIEKYSKNSRFCLICNNINKIIPGLQSRCTKMRFGYLDSNEIKNKLSFIIETEGVKINDNALERLINLNKDFRQILNTLQCLHAIKIGNLIDYKPIEADEINEYLGVPTQKHMDELINILFNIPFHTSCKQVNNLFKNNQWNISDLIHRLTDYVVNHPTMPDKQKYFLIDRLSDIEIKITHSNDAEIQLYALISAFQQSLLI